MADLVLTEEEKEGRSYLNWDDESLGKLVKKKAIEIEDYHGEDTAKKQGAIISLLSEVRKSESDMVMIEVEGLTINDEDMEDWRITFEKVDPDLPGGPDNPMDDNNNDGGGGLLTP